MTSASSQPARARGVASWRLDDTPVAVLAVETTGFPAGRHRICELALVRIEPRSVPKLAFDSLIDPGRPLAGDDIHGLRPRDLEGAPRFEEVAAEVVDHLTGAVLVAYNAAFSVPFLADELARIGVEEPPPHLSLMTLRPALGLGGRCSLEVACEEAGITCESTGCARADAEACADLYLSYRGELDRRRVESWGELAAIGDGAAFAARVGVPLDDAATLGVSGRRSPSRRVLRSLAPAADADRLATRRYWDAVTAALADFDLSDAELGLVRRMRELLRLPEERMRAIHARAFLGALSTFAGDDWLAAEEAEKLRSLLQSLARLGWSPGE